MTQEIRAGRTSTIFHLRESHFKYKGTNRLKTDGIDILLFKQKQRRREVAMLSGKADLRAESHYELFRSSNRICKNMPLPLHKYELKQRTQVLERMFQCYGISLHYNIH